MPVIKRVKNKRRVNLIGTDLNGFYRNTIDTVVISYGIRVFLKTDTKIQRTVLIHKILLP